MTGRSQLVFVLGCSPCSFGGFHSESFAEWESKSRRTRWGSTLRRRRGEESCAQNLLMLLKNCQWIFCFSYCHILSEKDDEEFNKERRWIESLWLFATILMVISEDFESWSSNQSDECFTCFQHFHNTTRRWRRNQDTSNFC